MADFTSSDGRRIAYSDTGGTGPAVLCLSGLTRDRRDFADLARHLSPSYRVVSMDYRGRGDSDWATEPTAEYHPMIEGRDAVELLTHLEIASVVLIGSSRGGLIGMGLAPHLPNLIRGLVLNDIGTELEQQGLALIMGYLGREVTYPSFEAAAARLEVLFSADAPTLTSEQWMGFARTTYHDDNGRPVLSYDPKLRDAVAAAIEAPQPDLWPFFDAIACPILVLRGANSNLLSKATVAEMLKHKPDLTAIEVANRGHCPFLDEPEALAAIDTFLAQQS